MNLKRASGQKMARQLVGAVLACTVLIWASACTRGTKDHGSPSEVTVRGNTVTISAGAVTVTVPGDAVPSGTNVSVGEIEGSLPPLNLPTSTPSRPAVRVVGDSVAISLGSGGQPIKPLSVSIAVDQARIRTFTDVPVAATLGLLVESADGSLDVLAVQWDGSTGRMNAQVPHLSKFWPVQLDLNAAWGWIRDTTQQAWNIKSAKPECVGKPANINGVTYQVSEQPKSAWVCVIAREGKEVIEVTPNSALPWRVRTQPAALGDSSPSDLSLVVSGTLVLARQALILKSDEAFVFPGVNAQMTSVPLDSMLVGARQEPAVLLMTILATTLTFIWGDKELAKLSEIGSCFSNTVSTGLQMDSGLTPGLVAGVFREFFACAGPLMGSLPGLQKFVLAVLSAAPQFLAASAIGFVTSVKRDTDWTVSIKRAGGEQRPNLKVIQPGRLGPIYVGQPASELVQLGLIASHPKDHCGFQWGVNEDLRDLKVWIEFRDGDSADDVDEITVSGSDVATSKGITVGSSLQDLQAAYPGELQSGTAAIEGGDVQIYVLFGPEGALIFVMGRVCCDELGTVKAMVAAGGTSMDDFGYGGGGC